jgi:hypothetical protein
MNRDEFKSDHQDSGQLSSNARMKTMASTQPTPQDDMPGEIDFAKGARGKFFRPDASLHLPVYLDAEVQAYLAQRAQARGIEVNQLVNELLKKDIELIEAAR